MKSAYVSFLPFSEGSDLCTAHVRAVSDCQRGFRRRIRAVGTCNSRMRRPPIGATLSTMTDHPPLGLRSMDEGRAVLDEAVAAFQAALGPRLLAAYALGSLAHGGFSPLVSDVDLGLVLADPPATDDPDRLQAVAETIKAAGPVLHQRLSVFWATPAMLRGEIAGGRFPPL